MSNSSVIALRAIGAYLGVILSAAACGSHTDSQPGTSGNTPSTTSALVAEADGRLSDFGISCHLAVSGEGVDAVVSMQLNNQGGQAVQVLRRGTAWDDASSVFHVTSPAGTANYVGISASRGPIDESEYFALPPQGAESIQYPIGKQYSVTADGNYDASLARDVFVVKVAGAELRLQHDCNTVVAHLLSAGEGVAIAREAVTFSNCSTAQQSVFNAAKLRAKTALDTTLIGVVSGNNLYRRWFGDWTSARSTTVTTVFNAMLAYWDAETIACDVTCTAGWGAYTSYHSGTIHLCPPYFSSMSNFSGEDYWNQTGTYIHEMSHERGSGVIDYAYGAANDLSLATSTPDHAILNADNYALYAMSSYVSWIMTPLADISL
ncbi:MAG TPA: M35 family metallopeptidase [Polyangiaceae bacterium]